MDFGPITSRSEQLSAPNKPRELQVGITTADNVARRGVFSSQLRHMQHSTDISGQVDISNGAE
jgi:hypothetical protein